MQLHIFARTSLSLFEEVDLLVLLEARKEPASDDENQVPRKKGHKRGLRAKLYRRATADELKAFPAADEERKRLQASASCFV